MFYACGTNRAVLALLCVPGQNVFDGERGGIHFADTGDTGVGVDLDDESVLPAVSLLFYIRQADVDCFYIGDFHAEALRQNFIDDAAIEYGSKFIF